MWGGGGVAVRASVRCDTYRVSRSRNSPLVKFHLNLFNQIFSFAIICLVCLYFKVCLHLINFISALSSSSRVLRSEHSLFIEYVSILNLFTLNFIFTSVSRLTNVTFLEDK